MPNRDIRLPTEFFAHRKTRELRRRGGAESVVALLQLWTWVAQHRWVDGDLSDFSGKEIAALAGYTGDDDFSALLDVCGFLDRTPVGFVLHQWGEHQVYCTQLDLRIERARQGGIAKAAKVKPFRMATK